MTWYMAIRPAGDLASALKQILARADVDPSILRVDSSPSGYRLYFCDSPEDAAEQRQMHQQYHQVRQSICSLKLSDKGITADLTGEEDSQRRLAGFIKWMLSQFAPASVYDSETKEDLSALAAVNPDALFE